MHDLGQENEAMRFGKRLVLWIVAILHGIGDAYIVLLEEVGVHSAEQLAVMQPEELRDRAAGWFSERAAMGSRQPTGASEVSTSRQAGVSGRFGDRALARP